MKVLVELLGVAWKKQKKQNKTKQKKKNKNKKKKQNQKILSINKQINKSIFIQQCKLIMFFFYEHYLIFQK